MISWRYRLAFIVVLLAPMAAEGQNPYKLKPGARGKVCFDCHFEIEDQLKLTSVHSPVRSGDCSDCHNPHASSHGQLLASDASEICSDCHEEVVPEDAASVHQAVLEESCATCHDPHASENSNMLVEAGNELCFRCHDKIAAVVTSSEFGHSPVTQNCMTCHDPHASTRSLFLLKKDTGSLCQDCHNTTRATFVERHMGYPVAQSRCTTCHDVHGSDRSGILLAEVHQPLTSKRCNQCHEDASAPNALAVKRTGSKLCRGCHSSLMNEMASRNRLHWPVADQDGCLSCHSPHASNQKALLLEPTTELCSSCHRESVKRQETSLAKHSPVADGDCSACHDPHAANNVFLMEKADTVELCGECHDWQSHSSHPLGANVIDQRNPNLSIDCLSCHRSHGSPFKSLSHLDPGGDLCVECHQLFLR